MVEEVATALLDASRRMSMSSSSTDSRVGGGWWDTSQTEVDDKNGLLPRQSGSWFAASSFGFGSRNRTVSESSGSMGSRLDPWIPLSWITGSPAMAVNNVQNVGGRDRKFSEPALRNDAVRGRMRRNSSKDIEEAMAGGLNKADIYMPQV